MTENSASQSAFGWLLEKFGVAYENLDPATQDLVKKIGKKGVKKLAKENLDTVVYRGERISREEALNKAQSLSALVNTSNEPRFVGPGSRKIKNKPKVWINEENDELTSLN